MITKSDFINWKQSEIAGKLNDVCNESKAIAIEDLIRDRGSISDRARGSIETLEEFSELLRTGIGLYDINDIEEDKDV